ncbi:TauD/TfdA family dioxygenase [Roseococcus sp. SDR]|uniref:TauD/TfdA dioxygenase family protein n=1 Tax=Roseococcus sp. SDR TaxID=2835532 RepID=UPI001BCD5001|nr:TauD/TfdA family dioxygenase [Roseococcus sp. SDR]MBS7790813.1 TauD/TfdA family dioxygenase [Roseococcus sp. SDR]MBV1846127.1 TauD/TfdA family dioxygenase [Roseococcus sp. SDR]
MLTVTPLKPEFGARIEGADLRRPLTEEEFAVMDAAIARYGVLVIPGQDIDDDQQMEFAARFGPIEQTRATVDVEKQRLKHFAMNDISNLDEKGEILAADDRRRFFSLGNRLWHSDSSFKATPAKHSLLHARSIPPEGGETEFADTRGAWEALPAAMQDRLRDMVCDHSLIYSRAMLGFAEWTEAERRQFAPVPQRLVRRHAESGRTALFLSSHIGRIHGMPTPEALMLIRDLLEHATQPRFVYSHRWAVGDLVMWDNRCTLHRGRAYDDQRYKRDMRRVTLSDVAPTLEQQAA